MKPAGQILGACALSLISGTTGYFLGSSHSTPASVAANIPDAADSGKGSVRVARPTVDVVALRALLEAEKNPLARFKLALHNMEGWVATNPTDALAWLRTQPATDRRDEVIRMALKQFAGNDPKSAADWVMKNLKGRELNNTIIMLAEDWAGQNGAEAAAWFGALPPSGARDAAIEDVLFTWATDDPPAALAFLKAHPDLADLAPVLNRAALAGWAKSDPMAAVAESLASSKADNDPKRFANTLANWATTDLDASSQWLLSNVPAGKERDAATAELGIIFARQSPEAGISWLGKLNAGEERDGAASALAATWSDVAPADAAKWVASQNQASLTPEAITEVAENFLMKDPAAFQAWRASLPDGPLKDQAAKVGVIAQEE